VLGVAQDQLDSALLDEPGAPAPAGAEHERGRVHGDDVARVRRGRLHADARAGTHDQYDVVRIQCGEADDVPLGGGVPVGHQRPAEPAEQATGAAETPSDEPAPEPGHDLGSRSGASELSK
jgi:hypothetical protein